MGEKLNVTELDYQQIKDNIISYFENVTDDSGNKIYKDYDFKGSALNTLIGILAYNTHYNAMLAHMAVNESFIDSAQLRSSVISAAKLLGYVPRSAVSPKAEVRLSFVLSPNINPSDAPGSISIDRNALFKTTYNDVTYYFVPQDGVNLVLSGDTYVTPPNETITLFEGQRVIKRFQASGRSDSEKYVIDDDNIDTNTLIVRVYPNANNMQNGEEFIKYSDITASSANAKLYYLGENSLGKYEISFGNNVISKKLEPLNVIEVEYITTSGPAANGAKGPFIFVSSTDGAVSASTSPANRNVIVVDPVSDGLDKESVESVRLNSTAGFVSQNRAVTADDYINIIRSEFSSNSVSVWGGEDNDPPQYGKVFVCVQTSDKLPLPSGQKNNLRNLLSRKKVLSIIPEIVDAEYVNIVLDVLFKYNSNITSLTKSQLENIVRDEVIDAYNNKLNEFGTIFRHSEFTKNVDTSRSAILNSHVRVFLSKTFNVNPDSYDQLVIKYGTELTVDDGKAIAAFGVKNIQWTYNNEKVFISDREDPTNGDKRILYTYSENSDGSIKIISDNVGTITLSSGILTLSTLGISDASFDLTIDLIPISDDIVSRRNQIINIDKTRCNVIGYIDEIEVRGKSGAISYKTFKRDR